MDLDIERYEDIARSFTNCFELYQTVYELHKETEDAIDTLKLYVKHLLEACKRTFNNFDEDFYTDISVQQHQEMIANLTLGHSSNQHLALELKEMYGTGHYFPGYPIKRFIPNVQVRAPGTKEKQCSKKYKQIGKNTPGVVFFFCMEHEKCIGFVIQAESESPRMISEVLTTRFSVIPEVIMYDNACNLAEFCWMRYPTLFENSIFVVDAFHFNSHTNCCSSFDSSANGSIVNINSSLAEQKNSKVKDFKKTSVFMKARTFMLKMRYTASYLNKKH